MRRTKRNSQVFSVEHLEGRVVLTVSGAEVLQPAALVDLHSARIAARSLQTSYFATPSIMSAGRTRVRPNRITPNQRLLDQVNQSFNSFQNDYLPVLSIYLSNVPVSTTQTGTTPQADNSDQSGAEAQTGTTAQPDSTSQTNMKTYLQQRTKLLSQELTRTLVRVPGFASKQQNGGVPLMTFLDRKILGSINGTAANQEQNLSLYDSLAKLIPSGKPAAGTEPIFTIGSINAIQAANAATINAMGYAAYNVFGKPSHR